MEKGTKNEKKHIKTHLAPGPNRINLPNKYENVINYVYLKEFNIKNIVIIKIGWKKKKTKKKKKIYIYLYFSM
jgi:hypothetical protein